VIAPLGVVIPALDAEATIADVVHAIRAVLPHAFVIVVDDGSRDRTGQAAHAAGAALVRFPRNRGKGAALRAGIAAAVSREAAAILTLDADGQHDPAAAPALLAALQDADIAIGTRARHGTAMPLRRRITNALASSAVGRIVGMPVADSQSGFRAFRRRVALEIQGRGDRFEYETDFLIRAARAGLRIAAVPVPTVYGGRSHFRPLTDSARIVRTLWRHRTGVSS
jgi:glycosyltransferase involved in cell wall biosynthesis